MAYEYIKVNEHVELQEIWKLGKEQKEQMKNLNNKV